MTVIYTDLAKPLLDFVDEVKAQTTASSGSLNINLSLSADFFARTPQILTANYGFDGYMGVPGLIGTDDSARQAAFQNNVSWESVDPALGAAARAYYSAVGVSAFVSIYGVQALLADTIPVVFSHPVLGDTMHTGDFSVTLNTGEIVEPIAASFLPNLEFNERQTVVITGDFGNRIAPGESGARYPVSVTIVDDGSPLRLVSDAGLISAVGLTIQSKNPYVSGNGPRILAAKLNMFSELGEGAPSWQASSTANSGSDLYGDQAMYRLRIYTSAGFSPDGIASISPDDFARFFQLTALDQNGAPVPLLQTDVDYEILGYGTIRILGIADTGLAQVSYDAAYVEDHDNQYDIILSGDRAAIDRLQSIRMPSGEGYSPVYNPGGPGNDPENNPVGPFTVPSSDQTVQITHDFLASSLVSYVEVDGPVVRNQVSGQPIGANRGLAVDDTSTGHKINQYIDPDGKIFFSSFAVSPIYEIRLTPESSSTHSRATDDQIIGSAQINSVLFSGSFDQYLRSGDLIQIASEDTVAFRDANDNLFGVERLIYTDTGLALDIEGHAGFAYSLYGVFERAPDVSGLGFWINGLDEGVTLVDVANNFILSPEFVEDYGSSLSNENYVNQLYQSFLQRSGDALGVAFWVGALNSGLTDRAEVLVGFSRSVEYQGLIASDIADGILYQVWMG